MIIKDSQTTTTSTKLTQETSMMQPRHKAFTTVTSFSLRRFNPFHSHVLKCHRSFTAKSISTENHCMVHGCRRSYRSILTVCEFSRQRRGLATTTFSSNDSFKDTENHPPSPLEGHTLPTAIQNLNADNKHSTKNGNHPRLPAQQSMVPISQQVYAIMRDIKIGELTKSDLKAIQTEAFTRSKIPQKNQIMKKADVDYAEQLVQRVVQEMNYRNNDLQQQEHLKPDLPDKMHLVQSLGAIWHYVILGSSHLPLIGGNRIAASNETKSDASTENPKTVLSEEPYMTTGRLLTSMLQLHHQNPSIYPPPTVLLYNAWLFSCFTCHTIADAVYTAEAILRSLEGPLNQDEQTNINPVNQCSTTIFPPPSNISKPTTGMYDHVILIHAKRSETVYGAAVQAEDWLMRMSKVGVHPSTGTFNRVLKAWADSAEKEGGNRAADLLHLMLKLCDGASGITHGHDIAPNEISFGTVIQAFSKRTQPEASQLILEEAVSYFATDSIRRSRMSELKQCWNAAFFGWATSSRPDAPDRVERLLNDGITVHDQQYKIKPNKSTYVACIEAYLKSGRPDRIDKAEQFLQIMVETMRSAKVKGGSNNNYVKDDAPTEREFNTLINAWFRSLDEFENISIHKNVGKHPIGYTSTKASNLLYRMLKLQEEGYLTCTPTSGSFHMCISSLCKTTGACISAAKKVKKVVAKTGDEEMIAKMDELAREYRASMKKQAMATIDKAFELLDISEHRRLSTGSCYASMIQILCRVSEPAYTYKAATILERYERKTDERNLKWQDDKVWMYHTIITSLNAIGTLEAAELALTILRRLPKSGKRAIDRNYIWLYTGVLTAFARHRYPRSGAVATELFVELISAPNQSPTLNNSINIDFCERVLWVLADTNTTESADAAYDVLNAIFDLYLTKKLSFEPSTKCFNACILALAQVRDTKYTSSCVLLLKYIIGKYEEKSILQLPTKAAFDVIIHRCNENASDELIQQAKDVTQLAEMYASSNSDQLSEKRVSYESGNKLDL